MRGIHCCRERLFSMVILLTWWCLPVSDVLLQYSRVRWEEVHCYLIPVVPRRRMISLLPVMLQSSVWYLTLCRGEIPVPFRHTVNYRYFDVDTAWWLPTVTTVLEAFWYSVFWYVHSPEDTVPYEELVLPCGTDRCGTWCLRCRYGIARPPCHFCTWLTAGWCLLPGITVTVFCLLYSSYSVQFCCLRGWLFFWYR